MRNNSNVLSEALLRPPKRHRTTGASMSKYHNTSHQAKTRLTLLKIFTGHTSDDQPISAPCKSTARIRNAC